MMSDANEVEQKDDQISRITETAVETLMPEVRDSSAWFDFSFNGLATPPVRAVRSFLRLFAVLEVLPGTWGVCYLSGEEPFVLPPGVHWLKGLQGATTFVQFVDARKRRCELSPVTGVSLDGWDITLQVVLNYEVVDPLQIARATDPITMLEAAAQAAILAQIEVMPHEALLGTMDTPLRLENASQTIDAPGQDDVQKESDRIETHPPNDNSAHGNQDNLKSAPSDIPINDAESSGWGQVRADKSDKSAEYQDSLTQSETARDKRGLGTVEYSVLERLRARSSLAGLQVIDVAVVGCYGDEKLVDILREEALARVYAIQSHHSEAARAELNKMQLEMQLQTAQAERTVALIQAESESQLASVEQQMKLLEARTEAEMQEIRQAQEAREAERKRMAEEWRTAKELDLRSMEYQHEETLAIIQGTAEITREAAKSGTLSNIQGNSRSLEVGNQSDGDAVVAGIQSLRGFREKIAPPATHFLPKPANAGNIPGYQERIQAESVRLERLRNADYELIIRHGEIAGARVWFSPDGKQNFGDIRLEFICPDGYPFMAPEITIHQSDSETEYSVDDWDSGLFLADLVREILLHLVSESE